MLTWKTLLNMVTWKKIPLNMVTWKKTFEHGDMKKNSFKYGDMKKDFWTWWHEKTFNYGDMKKDPSNIMTWKSLTMDLILGLSYKRLWTNPWALQASGKSENLERKKKFLYFCSSYFMLHENLTNVSCLKIAWHSFHSSFISLFKICSCSGKILNQSIEIVKNIFEYLRNFCRSCMTLCKAKTVKVKKWDETQRTK